MKSLAGIEVEKANQSVCFVVLSVRVQFMCCGSVQPIGIFVEKLWELLGNR